MFRLPPPVRDARQLPDEARPVVSDYGQSIRSASSSSATDLVPPIRRNAPTSRNLSDGVRQLGAPGRLQVGYLERRLEQLPIRRRGAVARGVSQG